MTTNPTGNTSDTARLLLGAPSFGVGWQQPVYIPQPPAGQGWKRKVDGRYYERVLAITFNFTADAVVANRFLQAFVEDNNGTVITSVPCGGTVVASTALNVNLALRSPSYANSPSGGSFGWIPDLLLPPDWSWSVTVFGADAADQISNIVMLVQQYPSDAAAVSALG